MDDFRDTDPFALFQQWLADAEASEPNDPTAMCLATADAAGMPSARMVLLKGVNPRGFTFYTNLDSRKGQDLLARPNAALCFHWKSLRRQVRVEGPVEPVTTAEADEYFASRARVSQLGARASHQSRPLDSRATLEARVADVAEQYKDQPVPRAAKLVRLSRRNRSDRVLERRRVPTTRSDPVSPGRHKLGDRASLPLISEPEIAHKNSGASSKLRRRLASSSR